jgi:hypothetical protein
MWVFIEMVDAVCIEERAAPFDAMYLIAFAKKKLRQLGPVLPGYAGDQSNLRHVILTTPLCDVSRLLILS